MRLDEFLLFLFNETQRIPAVYCIIAVRHGKTRAERLAAGAEVFLSQQKNAVAETTAFKIESLFRRSAIMACRRLIQPRRLMRPQMRVEAMECCRCTSN